MKLVQLGEICDMKSGGTPSRSKSQFYKGNIKWAKISDIEKAKNGLIDNTEERITDEGLAAIRNRIFPKGTLLLAMYGSVGKTAITGTEMSTNQAILGIRIKNDNQLDINYLNYWFQLTKEKLKNQAVGGTLKNISLTIVKKIKIPLPPLSTQKKIAEILDLADNFRQKTKALLEKYDQLAQSLFLDMFGDPVTNPKGWEVKKLGEYIEYLADIGSNGANKIVAEKLIMSQKEDYAFMVRTVNLSNNDFTKNVRYVSKDVYDFFAKSKVYGGELIMNKIGSAGDFWIMPDMKRPVSLGLNQFLIRFKILNIIYLHAFLSTSFGRANIKKRTRGAITKSITKSAVRDLPLIFAPIHLQNQFAERIQEIEKQKAAAKKSLGKADDLFNSLLQKAFKGELVAEE